MAPSVLSNAGARPASLAAPVVQPRGAAQAPRRGTAARAAPSASAALRSARSPRVFAAPARPGASPRSGIAPAARSSPVPAPGPIEVTDLSTKQAVPTSELEDIGVPLNTFNARKPFKARIVKVTKIVGPRATGETCHVVVETRGEIPFVEGQSYGVIPPGSKINSKGKEVALATRLYSIASTRYGDAFDGKTASFCIRRATYWDPELGREDPAKKGICSNYICDAEPGTEITMTGPAGKVLLLPKDPAANVIMVATGTGIAPFRAFWRRRFIEDVGVDFSGRQWLFMGAANGDATLYDAEIQAVAAANPDHFKLSYALSREQKNKSGGKMYIQDKMEEYADEIFGQLQAGAHIYFCGLKGMLPGITAMLERVATEKGLVWDEFLKGLKHGDQWHVEVY